MSGRQWSVSIRPDVGNRSEGVSGRPPVSGRPCVGILLSSCPPDDVAPDDDAHTYRSEPVGNSLCVLSLSPPVACVLLRLVSYYPKEIEAYRGNRSEPVSGRQWSVSIRPDVGNRSEGASGRPPVSGRPLSVFSCVPVLPMMSPR